MPKVSDTAYPRLKPIPGQKELERLFTPTPEEKQFAWARTNSETNTVRLLVWLKVFQRLGYFPHGKEIGGRPRAMTDGKIRSAKKLLKSGMSPRDVATDLEVSLATLYRWIPEAAALSQ